MTSELVIKESGKELNVEFFSDVVVEEFIASRHGSPNTAKSYRNAIRQLLKFFAAQSITAPTTADLDSFINGLRAAKKSPSTIRLYSTTAKLFFSYLQKRGLYADVAADCAPLKFRKSEMHKREALTDEQAKKLLGAVRGDSLIARRDKAILALALQCGLRTCEISRSRVGDLKEACGYWTLAVIGKGHQTADAKVKVAPVVAEMIQSYLALRGNVADDEPLFESTSNNATWAKNSFGRRLSPQSIGKIITACMKAAGVKSKGISAHSTRHFCATQAIKFGVDVREVSAMLRHSSIVVTSIYLHDLSIQTRRAEMAVANALFGSAA